MSLEAAIAELTKSVTALTEAQNEHTAKLDAILKAGGKSSASEEGEDKPKRTRAKKDEPKTEADAGTGDEDTTALTHDAVKKSVAGWLAEFANNEDDPETQARKDKIKGTLASMAKKDGFKVADEKKGATIADVPAKELHRVVAWLDKQKDADAGFGKGRLTEVPGADGDDAGSDDDEI